MKLRTLQVVGYGAGDAANNLAFSLSGMFLLLYYTDVVGLSAAAVGTMMLIVRVWDAFTDLFAGRLVDRTHTRWGKFRPFILFGSLPLLVLSAAVFQVPGFSKGGQLVYAYLSYALLGLAYSLVNIPYGSLATAMTQDPQDRARLGAVRGVGTSAVILMLVFIISPALEDGSDLQAMFTTTTSVFVVLGMALYLFTFFTAKEKVERRTAQLTLRQTVAALKGNRPLYVLCLGTVVMLSGVFSLHAIGVFYARDVLGDPSLFPWLTAITTAEAFLAAPLVPRIVKRIGKRGTYLTGGAVSAVGGLGVFVLPADPVALPIVAWGVAGLGVSTAMATLWALEADTVEYGEWHSGYRAEGAVYAIFSFTRKISQALGAAISAYSLELGHYAASAPSQSGEAVTAIRFAAGGAPALAAFLGCAIMWFYPLTERRFAVLVGEIADRRHGGRAEASRDDEAPGTPATTSGSPAT